MWKIWMFDEFLKDAYLIYRCEECINAHILIYMHLKTYCMLYYIIISLKESFITQHMCLWCVVKYLRGRVRERPNYGMDMTLLKILFYNKNQNANDPDFLFVFRPFSVQHSQNWRLFFLDYMDVHAPLWGWFSFVFILSFLSDLPRGGLRVKSNQSWRGPFVKLIQSTWIQKKIQKYPLVQWADGSLFQWHVKINILEQSLHSNFECKCKILDKNSL